MLQKTNVTKFPLHNIDAEYNGCYVGPSIQSSVGAAAETDQPKIALVH